LVRDKDRLSTTVQVGSPESVLRGPRPSSYPRPMLVESSVLQTGSRLADGRFEILRRLGEGGMGVVYEAFDAERRGRVALKTLTHVDAAGIYRLKNEFRALAGVHHPNLVRLHELFADEAAWFFTMDLVDGQDFDDWIDLQRFEGGAAGDGEAPWLRRLRDALGELVAAVSAIHRVGKLHRDLKPGNVMVRNDGRVMVLDFGLVADPELGGAGQTVLDGALAGTPVYMAPEQAAGGQATPASDWYALGVLLFESLTGRLPIFGTSLLEVLAAKQSRDAPRASDFAPGIPADLDQLCADLLARDPELRPDAESLRARLGSAPLPSSRPASSPPERELELVGRESELELLRDAYAAALDGGRPVVVMLEGESGIGKSSLMAHFLDELQARSSTVVLRGRCYERETMPFKAFDAVVDDLSRYLRRLRAEEAAALTPREAWALTRLFPVLGRIRSFAVSPGREGAEPQELRRRGFVAFGELLGRLRDRFPLVLHIDDLQWTDRDSVTLLMHLLRQSDAPQLLFVGSRRDGKCEHLDPLYEKLPSDIRMDFRRVRVQPLSAEMSARVLGSRAPAELVAEARGNPFLLRELARRGRERGAPGQPASLTEILLSRCRAQPEDAQRLLSAIALSAGSVPLDVATAAARVEPGALDALRDSQLVRQGARPGEVECYHDKIREALAAAISSDDGRVLHRDLARAWEQTNRADPEQLSLHYEGAGERQRAAELAADAAERAREMFGFERAVQLLTRALELGTFETSTRQRLRVARADALALSGRSREAAEACVLAMQDANPEEATDLARRAGGFYLQGGWLEEAIPLVNRGLEPHGLKIPLTERGALATLAWERARVRLRGGTPRRGPRDERAVRRFEAAEAIAFALPRQEPLRYAALATSLFRIALDSGDPPLVAKGLAFEAWTAQLLGTTDAKLQKLAERAQELCERDGDPRARFWLALNVGNAELQRDPRAALGHFERAQEILTTHPHPSISFLTPIVTWSVLNVRCLQGFFNTSAREVPALLDDVWAGDDRGVAPFVAGGPGAIARVAVGDTVSLRSDLERAKQAWQKDYFTWQDIMLTQGELALELHEGQVERARAIVAALEDKLSRSLARRAAPIRAYVEYLRVWADLAYVRGLEAGGERARLLERAAASLKFCRSVAISAIWSAPLEPAVEILRGRADVAAAMLREVVADRAMGERLPVYAVYARRALGSLLAGAEGTELVRSADEFLKARGVVDPVRFFAATAPGLAPSNT
jgi:eukaryotic-like serine/threonine-protein kinase